MGNFIEIISNYGEKMGAVNKNSDLHNYLNILTRFNNNLPFPKSLTTQIESSFSFFWSQDRLSCLDNKDDYLDSLPSKIQH